MSALSIDVIRQAGMAPDQNMTRPSLWRTLTEHRRAYA
jgi:hypothetical protein